MTKQTSKSDAIRNSKKKIVLGDRRRSTAGPLAIAVALVVALAGGIGYAIYAVKGQPAQTVGAAVVETANNGTQIVTHPMAMFDDGRAHHFEHKSGAAAIRYFILKSSDGVVRAAFDACDVCWPAGKGYVQEGDEMVCQNCGRRFASVLINEVKGGCNPAPLHRTVQGDRLIIQVSDILGGRQYFNFKGRA